jgi:hypothetical protein
LVLLSPYLFSSSDFSMFEISLDRHTAYVF